MQMVKFCEIIRPNLTTIAEYLELSYAEGKLSNQGPCCKLLKKRLQQFLRTDRPIVITSSCHVALMAAYASLGTKRALIPNYTFNSTYSAAEILGTKIFLSDSTDGLLQPTSLYCGIDYDTAVAVTTLSQRLNLKSLEAHCIAQGTRLIIDAAPAFGSLDLANYGDAVCYSFHATKSLPVGECGAVVFKDTEAAQKAERFINFGFDSDKNTTMLGINGKASEYTCAVALALLDIIEPHLQKRVQNARYYTNYLSDKVIFPFLLHEPFLYDVPQSYAIWLKTKETALIIQKELAQNGIESHQYYKPIDDSLPNGQRLYETNLCLPVHGSMSKSDQDTIIEIVNKHA